MSAADLLNQREGAAGTGSSSGEPDAIAATQAQYELDVYGKRGLTLVRGEGALVYDRHDRAYLDCIAGIGSANLGHAHPVVVEAVQRQAARLITCPGIFANDAKAELLEALVAVAPEGLNRAFLCNSGTESVEAALKFARLATGRKRFVTAKRAFHGRTFGAMSATHEPKYREGCEPLVPGFEHVRFNDVDALHQVLDESVAGLLLEVVQGEGGVYPADAAYLAEARRLCDEKGVLLIIDEVQTGFCRTGRFFGCEHYDLRPDIMCLAKSIAGGLPMGAVLVNDEIQIPLGKHGSTFGGNPLVCAVATAVIREMREANLAERAESLGNRFVQSLQRDKPELVREIRQVGLMIGIGLRVRSRPYLGALMERGILAMPAGTSTLRFLPPLVITPAQIDEVVARLREVLQIRF
ncbi:Acetylornithine/succinylornithine family transaminase [Sulfidibacter corallicola]|uniref:Acetylornithine/succinylornithine family transaminase n=1 Tax=Sulfidibacter corallicola TaxID=2818388 RepID=A0A8A4TPB7_SULCO|nr:acetylornithine/succinylornithine family transaminase [Sulfidibacter corallicola]QTD51393.1 acetylornithine/succinylornithine family transaminase [Sulfidibacter corallicola]